MNKKHATYLLLTASIVIWGTIAWRVIKTFNKDSVVVEQPRARTTVMKPDSMVLLLNYEDPFLKENTAEMPQKNEDDENDAFHEKNLSWEEPETVQGPVFTFKGILKVNEKTYGLLDFGGETIMVNQRDMVGDFYIVSIAPDKLVVRKQGFDIELYAE